MDIISVGVLTVSDRCSRGEAQDTSGANLREIVVASGVIEGEVKKYECVPDDLMVIKDTLIRWCDEENLQLILTTGGTGFSPRDLTPEAVKEVIEREAPGLAICMITQSLKVTPLAMLSRPVCGIRGKSLIITLPGSQKGSEECLRFIAQSIHHAVDLINGREKHAEETHSTLQAEGVKSDSFKHHHSHHHHHGHSHPHHHGHGHPHHHGHSHPHHHALHHCQHHSGNHGNHQESKADVSKISRRPRKSIHPMISVSQAIEIVLKEAEKMGTKTVPLYSALGYVLVEDIFAKDPLPPFPASIKDGYAVIASDGAGVRTVADDSTAGSSPQKSEVTSGTCVRVNTGAPIPPGADAVVQVEDTELIKEADDGCTELEIKILKEPFMGQDIRPLGCDITSGQRVLESDTLLGPTEMGLLATIGVTEVLVIDKPTVAILSTGNELQTPGEPLKAGHIRDSNKTTLVALVQQAGYQVFDVGIAKDDTSSLLTALKSAFSRADILVTSGGVSMGERDILRPVLTSDFSATVHFAQVFMKPGKPTTFATCEYEGRKKLILGLPGNPVSATVTATLYVVPLCRKMSGRKICENTSMKVKLSERLYLDPRPEYHRVFLVWDPVSQLPFAYSTGNQISSRLLSMASAQALLKLPPATPEVKSLPEGTVVDALVLAM
ncbi:hypothetical protein Pcinc_029314 [Petrolisthes cinctipes]|uniref:MoaB/Mog domain-containing protein n=1 Tax=Petrolisthes cinctipes TaxID=88211 RepID=A0AAE1K5W6_PETCI|nr:hypothetical protein Pcinc_029314 [Petrolisthes cinctipes]